jgi:hypothetical protein
MGLISFYGYDHQEKLSSCFLEKDRNVGAEPSRIVQAGKFCDINFMTVGGEAESYRNSLENWRNVVAKRLIRG